MRVLIIEDEVLIAEDLAMILTKANYKVVEIAYDAGMGIEFLHSRNPEIVLIDIALGSDLNGLDIARIINDKYKIPFIFITSFSDQATLNQAKVLMPAGYIVKPFKKKDILATVEMVSFKASLNKSKFCNLKTLNAKLHTELTNKEYEILIDVANGLSNNQISEKHEISINTTKTHLKRSFIKLEISQRTQVAIIIMNKE